MKLIVYDRANELRSLVQSFKNERIQDLTVLYQSLFVQIWEA